MMSLFELTIFPLVNCNDFSVIFSKIGKNDDSKVLTKKDGFGELESKWQYQSKLKMTDVFQFLVT